MKLYPTLSPDLAAWAQRQPLFLTATAGTHAPHVNVSPKGLTDSHFAVLSPSRCAYIDRTGSGCETIAHAYENGRICLMFMSFGQAPRILRLFCRASVVEYDDPRFPQLVRQVAGASGRHVFDAARAVIVADIWEVQTSCGYGVPRVRGHLYGRGPPPAVEDRRRDQEAGEDGEDAPSVADGDRSADLVDELSVFEARPTLDMYWQKNADDNTVRRYQKANNAASIDGLPGLRASRRDAGENLWMTDARAYMKRLSCQRGALAVGFALATLLSLLLRWLGV